MPTPAWAATDAATEQLLVLSAVAAGAVALAAAAALWAVAEQSAAGKLRRMLRHAGGRMRAAVGERDALLSASREALIVWGRDGNGPLSYGGADAMLESCLYGPEATDLSKALDDLADRGIGFTLPVHDKNGRAITVRGRAVGGMAAVWMEIAPAVSARVTDFREHAGCPARAGLAARRDALARLGQSRLSQRDRRAGRGDGARATSPRWKSPNAISPRRARNQRGTLEASASPSSAGIAAHSPSPKHRSTDWASSARAIDVTEVSAGEARLQQHIDAHADTLDKLATAVAIFGRDQKLSFYNRAFARLWGLCRKAGSTRIRATAKCSTGCARTASCRSSATIRRGSASG